MLVAILNIILGIYLLTQGEYGWATISFALATIASVTSKRKY